jgi:hypothetical protein
VASSWASPEEEKGEEKGGKRKEGGRREERGCTFVELYAALS